MVDRTCRLDEANHARSHLLPWELGGGLMSMLRETSVVSSSYAPFDKTFYLIKWISSVVALQDHKNFSMTVKQRKYDETSECF